MPTSPFPRTSPEAQGIGSAAVLAFLDSLDEAGIELHSLMLLRHGSVVAEGWWEPYRPDVPHTLWSLSKSFTSAAIGLAQAEGLLDVDDLVLDHLGDAAPPDPAPHLRAMRLRHLLMMSTGHGTDPSDAVFAERDWVRAFLALPVEHEPGTHFVYNTAATYVLSAVLQRVTGGRMLDYLRPRLLEPLGILDATWEQCPLGIDTGGFGLSLRTEEVLRFGQLLLGDGRWDGSRLLPEGWVAEATRRHGPSTNENVDWCQGYGYQFWRCRHDAYRGDGAFGQFCVVLPEQDAVLVTTAGTLDMQGVLDRVWTHLLPAMGEPVAEDPATHATLTGRLAALELPAPAAGPAPVEAAARLADRPVVLEANRLGLRSIIVTPGEDGDQVTIDRPHGAVILEAGHGQWVHQVARWPGAQDRGGAGEPEPIAVSARWTSPETYELTVRRYSTVFAQTLELHLGPADEVRVVGRVNVAFGPVEAPAVDGRLLPAG